MKNFIKVIFVLITVVPSLVAAQTASVNDLVGLGFESAKADYLVDTFPDKAETIFIPAGSGRAGTTAGWVNTGTNINQATVAASQTAGTFTIPVSGLGLGDRITAFKVVAQIESAGGAVTLDADLRKLVNAAGDPVDSSIGAITQVSVTADTAVAASKTLATTEVFETGDSLYFLLTATTAASTDIRLLGIEITVTRH